MDIPNIPCFTYSQSQSLYMVLADRRIIEIQLLEDEISFTREWTLPPSIDIFCITQICKLDSPNSPFVVVSKGTTHYIDFDKNSFLPLHEKTDYILSCSYIPDSLQESIWIVSQGMCYVCLLTFLGSIIFKAHSVSINRYIAAPLKSSHLLLIHHLQVSR
jgi:hypothetical protein